MKYLFWAGDSTVKKNRIDTFPQHGIGQMLEYYLKPDVYVINHAENGRSTKSFIDEGRLDKLKQQLVQKSIVLIQFGHNDSKEDNERHTEPYGSYVDNLKIFIDTVLKAGAFPVLVTPIERRNFDKNGKIIPSHGEYPKAMRQLAKVMGIPLIDLCEETTKLYEKVGNENSVKWFMHLNTGESVNYPNGLVDNTHLKAEGAIVIAGLVAEGLNRLGGVYANIVDSYDYRLLI